MVLRIHLKIYLGMTVRKKISSEILLSSQVRWNCLAGKANYECTSILDQNGLKICHLFFVYVVKNE